MKPIIIPAILHAVADKLSQVDIRPDHIQKVIAYLHRYGYLTGNDVGITDIEAALALFQSFVDVEAPTGQITARTLEVIDLPRCALPDVRDGQLIEENRWGQKELSYFISQRDTDMNPDEWDSIMAKAFTQWSDVANLKFNRVNSANQANLILSVGRGNSQGFDGPSGVLAWANLPASDNYKGSLLMRFDADEKWNTQIMLLNVACHEFGHMLGLNHSSVKTALMAPYYNVNIPKPQQNDDISRIQALYGPPATPAPTPTPPQPPVPIPPVVPEVLNVKIEYTGTIKSISIPGFRVTPIG